MEQDCITTLNYHTHLFELEMNDSIKTLLADRVVPGPSVPEWYFFVLVAALLIGLLAWKWLDLQKARIECPKAASKASTSEDTSDLIKAVVALQTELKLNTKYQEDKFAALERKLEQGFRAIHKRMDDHIDNHG